MRSILVFFVLSICVLNAEVVWQDDFEGPSSWQLNGEFEVGEPQGLGGEHGNPDPTSAYEGLQVLGVDLYGSGGYPGDYENNLGEDEYSAVSPLIDCSEYIDVELSFMYWLNVEQPAYDHASIDISNDNGTTWIELWTNTSGIENTSWSQDIYDLSSYADLMESVKFRFTIGPTDGSWQYSGWNIDNFIVTGEPVIYGAIEGIVQDSGNNEPVAFAQITSQFGNTISDSTGYFLLSDIPAGLRIITINAMGFLTYESPEIAVPENDTVFVLCEMEENLNTPPPPNDLQAEVFAENNVHLTWLEPDAEEILLAYNVYRNGYLIVSVLNEDYSDLELQVGTYSYFVSAVYDVGESLPTLPVTVEITGVSADDILEKKYQLRNYPNPFNPTTTISFYLASKSKVSITVYNVKGQFVKTLVKDFLEKGTHSVEWNGTDSSNKMVSSGVYFYKVTNANSTTLKKMLLLK